MAKPKSCLQSPPAPWEVERRAFPHLKGPAWTVGSFARWAAGHAAGSRDEPFSGRRSSPLVLASPSLCGLGRGAGTLMEERARRRGGQAARVSLSQGDQGGGLAAAHGDVHGSTGLAWLQTLFTKYLEGKRVPGGRLRLPHLVPGDPSDPPQPREVLGNARGAGVTVPGSGRGPPGSGHTGPLPRPTCSLPRKPVCVSL